MRNRHEMPEGAMPSFVFLCHIVVSPTFLLLVSSKEKYLSFFFVWF